MKIEKYIESFKNGLKELSSAEKKRNGKTLSVTAVLEKFISINVAKGRILYHDAQEISSWFIKEFSSLQANKKNNTSAKEPEILLYTQLHMKISNATKKKMAKIFVGRKTGEEEIKKVPLGEISQLEEFFFAEKDDHGEMRYYKKNEYQISSSSSWLIETDSIPGVNIVQKKDKNNTPVTKKKIQKKDMDDFTNAFGGAKKEDIKDDPNAIKFEGKIYLSTISSYAARGKNLPQITADGQIIEGSSLEDKVIADNNEIKALGGVYDPKKFLYYVPKDIAIEKLKKWLPDEVEKSLYGEVVMADKEKVKAKIATDLYSKGLKVSAKDLYFDGSWKNVSVIGKESKKQGSYRIRTSGDHFNVDAKSFAGNEDTQKYETLVYKIDSRRSALNKTVETVRNIYNQAIEKARKATREENDGNDNIELLEDHIENAKIAEQIYQKAIMPDVNHKYLAKKGLIGKTYTLKMSRMPNREKGNALIMPLYDVDGRIWSIQKIFERPNDKGERQKEFGIGGRKNSDGKWEERPTKTGGRFYIASEKPVTINTIGDHIAMTEGLATGAEIERELNYPVVVALFKDNLKKVTREILKKHPGKKIIIFADNDLKGDLDNPKPNVGLKYANAVKDHFGNDIVTVVELDLTDDERIAGCTDWNDVFLLYKDNRDIAVEKLNKAMNKAGISRNIFSKDNQEKIASSSELSKPSVQEDGGVVSPP